MLDELLCLREFVMAVSLYPLDIIKVRFDACEIRFISEPKVEAEFVLETVILGIFRLPFFDLICILPL